MIYLSLEQTSKSEQHMYGVFSLNSYEFCRAKLQKLGVLAYNQVKKKGDKVKKSSKNGQNQETLTSISA